LQSVFAFFPKDAAGFLADMVSSSMLNDRTKSQAAKNNHYVASTEREILLWIAQRCDFTLNVKEPIKAAYASVLSPLFFLSNFLPRSDLSRVGEARQNGLVASVSLQLDQQLRWRGS
jgi:hypothetical protein